MVEPRYGLVDKLGARLAALAVRTSGRAASELAADGIYGFWLMHEYFGMFSVLLFTKAGLLRAVERHPTETVDRLRWAIHWPDGSDLDDPQLRLLVGALDSVVRTAAEPERSELLLRVERACLLALQQVRESHVLDEGVVLALGGVEQALEETYCYAEQLCSPRTLARLRSQLPWLNWRHVDQFRTNVARL